MHMHSRKLARYIMLACAGIARVLEGSGSCSVLGPYKTVDPCHLPSFAMSLSPHKSKYNGIWSAWHPLILTFTLFQ